MPNFPVSSISFNADIPIYLDSDHGRTPTRTEEPPYEICLKCSASSRDQPIHCISKPLPPPPYEIAAPPTPCPGRSAIPVLNLQTPAGDWSNPVRPHRPAPAFRPDDDGRRVRFRHNAFSPISPQTLDQRLDNHVGNHIGLGIPDAPFKPDASPITPGTAEKAEKTKELRSPAGEGSSGPVFGTLGLVQRVEERLWKYSASRNVVKRWLVEIISWCISALCTAIIIIVLFIYQRRPIPKWPLGLTLNAFISVLAKIASAALLLPVSEALGQLKWNWFQGKQNKSTESKKMWDFELFDNASRGPWGSFLLLLRTKGRSLAALGCAVTIFALAMDPFFQQVVAFPETWRIQPRNGSLARAVTYSRYVAEDYFLGSNFEVLEPDQMMSSTAFRYFFEQGTKTAASRNGNWSSSVESRPEIPLTCPANKCTWTEYETLAVCNRCKEIPDRLEFRCRTSTLDWIPDPVVLEDLSYWDYPNGTACGWYLIADDPVLMTGYVIDLSTNHTGNVLVQRSQPLYDVFTRAPLPGYAAKMNDTRNPIAHFVTVSGVDAVQVRQNATPIANECMISVRTANTYTLYALFFYRVTDLEARDLVVHQKSAINNTTSELHRKCYGSKIQQ